MPVAAAAKDSIKIAHLSDLHLGSDLVWRSLARKRAWWKAENRAAIAALADALRQHAPRYVVVSGDIVNKVRASTFARAAATLRQLFQDAGIDVRDRVLVIPGNHDVPVLDGGEKRLEAFSGFLKALFGQEPVHRSERFVKVDVQARLCFFCLDSTYKAGRPVAEGKVGELQIAWLRGKIQKLKDTYPEFASFAKIAVLHHHPYAVLAGGSNRMMELDDAAETQRLFEECDVNVVLHGHKHFPHIKAVPLAGGNHLTVIGAGTAICPFHEEHAGEGNSFNLLEIRPSANVLDISRLKLNNNGVFEAVIQHREPLFRPSERGYKMREYVWHTTIKGDGRCVMKDIRRGLTVDSRAGDGLRRIAFFLGGLPEGARIENFGWDGEEVEGVTYQVQTPHERRGAFLLKRPLRWGGESVNFEHWAEVSKGVALAATPETPRENVTLRVIHPCDTIVITIDFPPGYRVRPKVRFLEPNLDELRPEQVAFRLDHEEAVNRVRLEVKAPLLRHEYGLCWDLP